MPSASLLTNRAHRLGQRWEVVDVERFAFVSLGEMLRSGLARGQIEEPRGVFALLVCRRSEIVLRTRPYRWPVVSADGLAQAHNHTPPGVFRRVAKRGVADP